MADAGLYQSQSQKLAIGPQMQQSLHVLQAATLELRQIVAQELAVNPVLEVEQPDVSLEDAIPSDPDARDDSDRLSEMAEEWKDYWSQSKTPSARSEEDEERHRHMMDSITVSTTLQEHLMDQLRLSSVEDPALLEQVEFLIGNLNEDGLLATKLGDLSFSHGIPIADLEAAHAVLISFEPPGIGAQDLRECLLLQMERNGRQGSLAWRLVDTFLDDLAHRRYPQLSRKLAVPVEQISRAAQSIGQLDPRPGSRFAEMQNHYVSPDVIIERDGSGWKAVMVGDDLPQLRISNAYKDMLGEVRTTDEARNYLREKIRSGKFLIRSIHQRQQTVHKIATEIIKNQSDFLDKGRSHLHPMNMTRIADAVGVHETTVSRAIANKYIRSPNGVVEMRFFFSQGLSTDTGEDLSNTSVKEAIAEIIAAEPSRKPLSDDRITKMLNERGIHVARRTVAKYREALNILPSHLRKSFS
jgi:RNA polymerase sigma-54 factor